MRTVTSNGSNTSDGISEPCSLTRAIQIANMNPPDRTFEVLPGQYKQPQLTLSGNDAEFMFNQGAELIGARTHVTGEWTQTSERVWTIPYAEPVGSVVQLGNWNPILVDDHNRDGVSFGRPYTLVHPIKLKRVSGSIGVAAQYGTWTQLSGMVHVHMYHSGRPTEDDLLHFTPQNWGSFIITGSNNQITGLTIRNTSGTGLYVKNSAKDNGLYNIKTIDAQVWFEGVRTQVNGIDISHVQQQGVPTSNECWVSNDAHGECWNAFGDGRGLLIGREGTTWKYNQRISNAYIHRCWNGARIDGPNVLERATLWGFANHSLEASGNNVTIRNCVINQGQDSLFVRVPTGFSNWNITDNVFHGAIYLVASKDGTGGVAPGTWQLRNNVYNSLVVDYWVHRAMSSSNNVRIDNQGNGYRVLDTNGERGFSTWDIPEK